MILDTDRLLIGDTTYNVDLTDRDTLPTAYAPARITGGRSTGIDEPDPFRFIVDVTVPPAGTDPQVGDLVEVDVSSTATGSFEAFRGQVESLTRQTRDFRLPDGSTFTATFLQVTAVDWLGVLARRTVGDDPWPEEGVSTRWARIAALVPDAPISTEAFGGNARVAPRDVDNTSVASLMRDTLAVADVAMTWVNGEIQPVTRSNVLTAPDLWDRTDPEGPYIRGGDFATIDLEGAAFTDSPDIQDYDLVVNVASVSGKVYDAAEDDYPDRTVTFTNAESRDRHGESIYRFSGDGMPDFGSDDFAGTAAARRARRLVVVAGDPTWRLSEDVELLPWRLTSTQFVPGLVADLTGWHLPIVRFVGAPVGRDIWRVIGLEVEWGADDVDALRLTVEPYELSAPLGLTFLGTVVDPPFTFDDSAPMTFDQALTIGSVI